MIKNIKVIVVIIMSFVMFTINTTIINAQVNVPQLSYKLNGNTDVNSTYEIEINISNIEKLYGFSLDFAYDSSMIQIVDITKGNLFEGYNSNEAVKNINSTQSNYAVILTGNSTGISKSSGTLAKIKVKSLKAGKINLNTISDNSNINYLNNNLRIKLSNPNASAIKYNVVNSFTIEQKNSILNMLGFSVNNITSKSTSISGRGEVGSTIKAYVNSKEIGSTTVKSNGSYSMTIPAQKANTTVVVKATKTGYQTVQKSIKVIGIASTPKKLLTTDIYRYDAGSNGHLTYINGKGYSQYGYLNKSEKYAFTPSSWMVAAGLSVSMPAKANNYTMTVDNDYISMYNDANEILNKLKSGKISSHAANYLTINLENKNMSLSSLAKAVPKKTLTTDIYRYDAGSDKKLTYINGKGYSQYAYLNKSEKYAFTPSSWMVAAGLTVTMPTKSNGYTMKITNPYITKYNNVVKEINNYL